MGRKGLLSPTYQIKGKWNWKTQGLRNYGMSGERWGRKSKFQQTFPFGLNLEAVEQYRSTSTIGGVQ